MLNLLRLTVDEDVFLIHKQDGRSLPATYLGMVPGSFRRKFRVYLGDEVPSEVYYSVAALENYDIKPRVKA